MNRIHLNKRVLFLALFLVVPLMTSASGWGRDGLRAKIILKSDLTSEKALDTFSAYDKIYALVTLSGLRPGSHRAVFNWIDPAGNINQYKEIPFAVGEQTSYAVYSWIRLLRNGPLKTTLSGKRFDDEYIGKWQLHLFVDGKLLKKTEFTIHP